MHTVLVIDDEQGFLQIIRVVLERAGFRALTAANGEAGLQMAARERPHLIILDDMMPGLSGGDVCQQLKRDPALQTIPVIMHSAGTRVKDPRFIESIGADGVLVKPTLPRDLVTYISGFIPAAV